MEIKAPNSTLHYEIFPGLTSGFLYRVFIINLVSTCQSFSLIQKTYPSKHTEVFEREI